MTVNSVFPKARLKYAATLNMGQSPSSEDVFPLVDGPPFVQGNAEFGGLNPAPDKQCFVAPKSAQHGDVLVSVRAPVGAVNTSNQKIGIGRGLCALTPNHSDSKFLFYSMVASADLLASESKGSTFDAITAEELGRIPISLPSLELQRKIVDYLDGETAKIDTLINEKVRLLKLLDERRQALITEAVTRGLYPTVPLKPSNLPWLGDIPAHWTVKKLKYLFKSVGGGTPSKEKQEFWDGEIPWVSPKDMKSNRITDTEDHLTALGVSESAAQLVPPGAVLIVCRSGILKHSIPVALNEVSVTLNQDMRALIPNGQISATYMKWLVWSLQSALLAEWSKAGATVESLE